MMAVPLSHFGHAALASVFLMSGAAPGSAQEMFFRCFFDWVCDADRGKCEGAGLDVRYTLDTETNRAARVGAKGPGRIDAIIGDRAVTLVETPISGGVSTTTVMLTSGDAVYSSHAIDGVVLTTRQYLGDCVAQ